MLTLILHFEVFYFEGLQAYVVTGYLIIIMYLYSLCHPTCCYTESSEAGGEIWFRVGPSCHSSQSASNGS